MLAQIFSKLRLAFFRFNPAENEIIQDLAQQNAISYAKAAQTLFNSGICNYQRAKKALEGYKKLSPRQKEVVSLITDGLSYHNIAQKLKLSHQTVKAHVRNILPKMGVDTRKDLEILLFQWDL